MATVILSAATACPAAVVNEGQLINSVPAPGCPFAKNTVPDTVVVLTVCAIAVAASVVASTHTVIPRAIRNHFSFMSSTPIAFFFSLQFAVTVIHRTLYRWGRPHQIGPTQFGPTHPLGPT